MDDPKDLLCKDPKRSSVQCCKTFHRELGDHAGPYVFVGEDCFDTEIDLKYLQRESEPQEGMGKPKKDDSSGSKHGNTSHRGRRIQLVGSPHPRSSGSGSPSGLPWQDFLPEGFKSPK